MRKTINFILLLVVLGGCQRRSNQFWENVKTAGRYLNRSIDALCGKDHDSCWISSQDEFLGPTEEDYIPLSDSDLKTHFRATDEAIRQPKFSMGQSGIPGMEKFMRPTGNLSTIFKTLHFETDDHVVRMEGDLKAISRISHFLKKNPKYYLVVEGHCDERASAAYNMALGTRRANHVRVLLIRQGVDFNKVYTVSYGKEKPIALGHDKQDWRQNRRAEFRIYKK